jgi:hypothetical protein
MCYFLPKIGYEFFGEILSTNASGHPAQKPFLALVHELFFNA